MAMAKSHGLWTYHLLIMSHFQISEGLNSSPTDFNPCAKHLWDLSPRLLAISSSERDITQS